MRIPEDWDKPSPGNHKLCEKFEYGSFEYQGNLPYRLFKPEGGEKVPLVVYLHGADAFGNDNEAQLEMHDIGTVFARDTWQERHPAYILAPQVKASGHWAGPRGGKVCALISELVRDHSDIDTDRIYIYGYSAGGIGALKLIKDHPGLFAAAIPICAATDDEDLECLKSIPVWLIHAADDEIVKVSYRNVRFPGSTLGSRDIYEVLKDSAPKLRYTEYPEGYMKSHYGINPHCTWVPAAENEEAGEWMFSKKKGES
ncbi:MAG: prolyl oligopeptidase family serine peptidase [Lachnospiraceae bacterium]|nr:prolyl oligopeptidase family serine peptidase [Lachnospiraceae bacterium]